MNIHCPACKQPGFPFWKKVMATWPFAVRCGKCKERVRLDIPRWQNILVQILGQFVFWVMILIGINSDQLNAIAGGIIGFILALVIAMMPAFFADLKVFAGNQA